LPPAPNSYEAWSALGEACGGAGRHAEAEQAFRHALSLRPDLYQAHYNLGLSIAYQERLGEAVEHFLAARNISPRHPDLQKTLFPILVTLLQGEGSPAPLPALELPTLPAQPLVSVVIPTRDRPRMLVDALRSVGGQSYPHWEALVVNDGGGNIAAVLESLPREWRARMIALEHATPRGPAAARNAAISAAKGAVLAFLDDDDRYGPSHLERLVAGLQTHNAAFTYTAAELVREKLADGKRLEVGREPFLAGLRYSRALLLLRNFIPINTWGVRRECFERAGPFDEGLEYLEDWDFLLRLSAQARFHQQHEVTVEYRVTDRNDDSLSKRHAHKPAMEALYRRHASDHPWVSAARSLYLETLA
jgi:tetratricopeptide (TPR) repeat protein